MPPLCKGLKCASTVAGSTGCSVGAASPCGLAAPRPQSGTEVQPDLNQYATAKAVDGLFKLVAQEGANIC